MTRTRYTLTALAIRFAAWCLPAEPMIRNNYIRAMMKRMADDIAEGKPR